MLNRADRRRMKPAMVGKTTPDEAAAYMQDVFQRNIERGAALHLLQEVLEHGLSDELRARIEAFLEKTQGVSSASG